MEFTLNLQVIYQNICNEYDEPISEFLSYDEFLEALKKADIGILRSATGDFLYFRFEEVEG